MARPVTRADVTVRVVGEIGRREGGPAPVGTSRTTPRAVVTPDVGVRLVSVAVSDVRGFRLPLVDQVPPSAVTGRDRTSNRRGGENSQKTDRTLDNR